MSVQIVSRVRGPLRVIAGISRREVVAEIQSPAGSAATPSEEVEGKRKALAAAVGQIHQAGHAYGNLAAVRGMPIGDVQSIFRVLDGPLS